MNKKPFALILLLSTAGLTAKTTNHFTEEGIDKEAPHNRQEHYDTRPPLTFGELFNEIDRSMRATTVELMGSMQEGLGHLQKEIATMNEQLKKTTRKASHQLHEEADKVKLDFKLPEDLKYEPADIEVINNKVASLIIKTDDQTVSVNVTLDRNILSGRIKTEAEVKTDKIPRKSHSESRFTYSISGKALFDKITAEYDEKTHTLSFVIPKEFEVENKRAIKVSVKK